MLNKTIVFITHDFDEAIRLADRIAIMQDGRVIQLGTPEELVTRPATDYVAEFTRDVSRAKVLSAASVMQPYEAGAAVAGTVEAKERIAAVAERVVNASAPFLVEDAEGRPLGLLTREAVLQVLVGAPDRGGA
jgi:glycine betaine/proline transport system ATP-binding protein